MTRDRLAEIGAIRERGKGLGHSRGMTQLTAFVDGWYGDAFRAPNSYVVIKIATILEVFTREWAAQIIDIGNPFATRAAEYVKGSLKIDFVLAQALVGRQLTFGELISHEISVSSIGDIDRIFSALLNESLFRHLEGVTSRWAHREKGDAAEPLLPDPDNTKATLAKLFERRHIFVHELPEDENLEVGELDAFIGAAHAFVSAADQAFSTLVHGDYPLTQLEMNAAAQKSAQRAQDELESILVALDPDGVDADLRAAQAAWEAYRDRQAEFRSGILKPMHGSIAPMIYSAEVDELTRARVEQLRWYLDRDEGDI